MSPVWAVKLCQLVLALICAGNVWAALSGQVGDVAGHWAGAAFAALLFLDPTGNRS